jgi:ATP-dependent 26S proteasome regulatory subunit/DNA-binding protein YbaB
MDNIATSLPNLLTTQFMGVAMMKDNISITQLISAFILMQFCSLIPQLKHLITVYINKKFNRVKNKIVEQNLINSSNKQIKSKITFIKSDKKRENDFVIDAINYHITNIESSKYLTYCNDYFVTNDEEFEISNEVYCVAHTKIMGNEEQTENIEYNLQIYSYTKSLYEIRTYVEKLKEKYAYEQKNKLGNKKYFFDEQHVTLPKEMNGEVRFAVATPNMNFKMTQFNTNKSLSNIFGEHLRIVKDRVHLFIDNPQWYEEKGIPYTLGIMLHGPPGTGKTSLIKAIAKDTKRHIFNIKLYGDTTQTQLRNLFFNETVYILQNGKTESYNIPMDERIYVIEDIDCLTDIVKERNDNINKINENSKNVDNSITLPQYSNGFTDNRMIGSKISNDNTLGVKQETSEGLTLSFILNLLDGILETPGRILIVTTNKPETLDKAFIRPGRIDLNIEVGYCTLDMIKEMYSFFFNTSTEEFDVEYKNKITPAELNKIMLDNIENKEKAYKKIISHISI